MASCAGLRAARQLSFEELTGWRDDDHAAALRCFQATRDQSALLRDWRGADPGEARDFFETHFVPLHVRGTEDVLFTGYYEPEIAGARECSAAFPVPLHRAPPDLSDDRPWATRAEIETQELLAGRGLEIAWIAHEIDRFFLQVQGSGRIRLTDGSTLRLGFGGRNGHPYTSIGKALVAQGIFAAEEVTAEKIRNYVLAEPAAGRALMHRNASYVFFRELPELGPDQGPIGTMGQPVTAGRTLAVDPGHVPLGLPVWVETTGAEPLRRLMIAQDTGSAIQGPGRADIFVGTGDAAGKRAGALRDPGSMVVLFPKALLLSDCTLS